MQRQNSNAKATAFRPKNRDRFTKTKFPEGGNLMITYIVKGVVKYRTLIFEQPNLNRLNLMGGAL